MYTKNYTKILMFEVELPFEIEKKNTFVVPGPTGSLEIYCNIIK